jgi:hypothetical protein
MITQEGLNILWETTQGVYDEEVADWKFSDALQEKYTTGFCPIYSEDAESNFSDLKDALSYFGVHLFKDPRCDNAKDYIGILFLKGDEE